MPLHVSVMLNGAIRQVYCLMLHFLQRCLAVGTYRDLFCEHLVANFTIGREGRQHELPHPHSDCAHNCGWTYVFPKKLVPNIDAYRICMWGSSLVEFMEAMDCNGITRFWSLSWLQSIGLSSINQGCVRADIMFGGGFALFIGYLKEERHIFYNTVFLLSCL